MTITDLQHELEQCGASLQLHPTPDGWVALLYAPEDFAGAYFVGTGAALEIAIRRAFFRWKGTDLAS